MSKKPKSPSKSPSNPQVYYVDENGLAVRLPFLNGLLDPSSADPSFARNINDYNDFLKANNRHPDHFIGNIVKATSTDDAILKKGIAQSRRSDGKDLSDDEPDDEDESEQEQIGQNPKRKTDEPPKDRESMQRMLTTVVSFAASNSAVGLANVRAGVVAYRGFAGVKDIHMSALLSLGLSSVGTLKRIWANDLIEILKGLGTVPGIFAGAGGTYKAFLYLGYDILMHLSESTRRNSWPEWLTQTYNNCERVCPGGRITNAQESHDGRSEKQEDRNAAIVQARRAFSSWTRFATVDYESILLTVNIEANGSARKGVITKYAPKEREMRGRARVTYA